MMGRINLDRLQPPRCMYYINVIVKMKYFEFAFDQYRFCSDVNTEVTTFYGGPYDSGSMP